MTNLKFTPFTTARFELLRAAFAKNGITLAGYKGTITDHDSAISYELAAADPINPADPNDLSNLNVLTVTVRQGPKILWHRVSEQMTCAKITDAVNATASG